MTSYCHIPKIAIERDRNGHKGTKGNEFQGILVGIMEKIRELLKSLAKISG